ncbi:MAG TPA: efflux RND transporter periplasmic adaptor subunit, partial [Polyangiaceae bacterium]|nr:efflux RND transporter periplasmic adaptor subunit [Polyangiaceae bacterium]
QTCRHSTRATMNASNISAFRHMTRDERSVLLDGSSGDVEPQDPLRALQIGEEQRSRQPVSTVHRRFPRWWQATVLGAVVIAGGAAWAGLRSKPIPVQATTVLTAARPSGGLLTAGGYVRHARVVHVVARVSGVIVTLLVSEGDIVHEGDLIATLDRRELEQQAAESRAELKATQARLAELRAGGRREEIASARAKVDALRSRAEQSARDKERIKTLADSNAVSAHVLEGAENDSLVAAKNLEEAQQSLALLEAGPRHESIVAAQAGVDAARARYARATDLLGRTEIRAPLSGRVLRKFLDVGAVVSYGLPYTEGYSTISPGSPIVSIGQLEGLEATADINQSELGRLSVGERVEVSADAFPGKTYQARLARISPRADRNKNTVEVTVQFNDPMPGELAHDMSVKLSFLGSDQAGTVPLAKEGEKHE